jgi:hypothetical protein
VLSESLALAAVQVAAVRVMLLIEEAQGYGLLITVAPVSLASPPLTMQPRRDRVLHGRLWAADPATCS